jgi:hypothetical protein
MPRIEYSSGEYIMNIGARWGVLLAGALLAGCAGLETGYVHRDGVRPGTVTAVGNDREMLDRLSDTCVAAKKTGTYALIRYTGNSHLRWRAFPVPEGMEARVGDKVSLDVNACQFTRIE